MTIALEKAADVVLLPVKALPGSRRNAITGEHDGQLKVAVTQVAEKGRANSALIRVLADALQLRTSQITLHSGPTNARKVFRVEGVTLEQLRDRLAELI